MMISQVEQFGEIHVERWSKLAKYENKTLFLKLAFKPIRWYISEEGHFQKQKPYFNYINCTGHNL